MPESSFERGALPLAQRLKTGVLRISMALRTEANREIESHGLSPLQSQILTILGRSAEGLRLAALAADTGVRPATASGAVSTLVRKRLVRKYPSPSDARAVALSLTATGRRAAERLATQFDFLAGWLDRLSAHQGEVLLQVLVRLLRDLQDSGRIPVVRMCPGCRFFRPNLHPGSAKPHHCEFANAPFGPRAVRLDCPDFEAQRAAS